MFAQVKKVYEDIYKLLEANQDEKVSSLLPEILELVKMKQLAKTFKVDEEGNVTHVYCYYHKQWEDVSVAEYGSKVNSASKLNSMCKEGVNQWTKQQREYKKAKGEILNELMEGSMTKEDAQAKLEQIEEDVGRIVPREDGHFVEVE
jgi:hypothetical protein